MTDPRQRTGGLAPHEAPSNTNGASTQQEAKSEVKNTRHPAVATDASRRRDRIKLLLGSITETTGKLADLIEAARDGEDHRVLGFASWTAYVAAEFSGLLTGLGTADRRVAVHVLAASGMPTRAIAQVAGISQSTAARDARVSQSDSPAPARSAKLAQRRQHWAAEQEAAEIAEMADVPTEEFEAALTAAREQDDLSRENVISNLPKKRVTGAVGKSYSQQAPPVKPRRRPLPDAYNDAVFDLEKVLARLQRLTDDDRFAANRDALADRHRYQLDSADALLNLVCIALTEGGDR